MTDANLWTGAGGVNRSAEWSPVASAQLAEVEAIDTAARRRIYLDVSCEVSGHNG
jgi:predicted SAM-dependent methyltransferase